MGVCHSRGIGDDVALSLKYLQLLFGRLVYSGSPSKDRFPLHGRETRSVVSIIRVHVAH